MAADYCDLVALVAHGPAIAEYEEELSIPVNEMGRLEQDSRQRIAGFVSSARAPAERNARRPLLGMVHEYDALGHAVGGDDPGRDDAVSVVSPDPFTVLDTDLLRILGTHPGGLASAP